MCRSCVVFLFHLPACAQTTCLHPSALEEVFPLLLARPSPTLPMFSARDPFPLFAGLQRSEPLTRFYRAALNATFEAIADAPEASGSSPSASIRAAARIWRLHDPEDPSLPLKWPLLDAYALFERDFYGRFEGGANWMAGLSGPTAQKWVVLGQPGIGKSAFGIWLLTQLLRRGRTVVYSRSSTKSGGATNVFHDVYYRGVAFTLLSPFYATALLKEPSVVHICDGLPPALNERCHRILITPPDPLVWLWFAEKEFARVAHFPLFSDAELETLRAAEFVDGLSRETLGVRIRAWGRVPRQVFGPDQKSLRSSIVRALSDMSLDVLQRAMSQVDSLNGGCESNETPHTLFLIDADRETLCQGAATFRSEAVARRAARQIATKESSNVVAALQQLLESNSTRNVAGTVFELASLEMLGRGGVFKVRPLHVGQKNTSGVVASSAASSAGSSINPWTEMAAPNAALAPLQSLHFEPFKGTPFVFDSLEDVAKVDAAGIALVDVRKQRLKPRSKTNAAIDSIEPGLRLVQCTLNQLGHGLKVTSGRSQKEGLQYIARTLLPLIPERWSAKQPYLEVFIVMTEAQSLESSWFVAQELEVYDSNRKGRGSATSPVAGLLRSSTGSTSVATPATPLSILPCIATVDAAEGGGKKNLLEVAGWSRYANMR